MLKVKFRFRSGHRDVYSPVPPWRLRTIFLNLTERCHFRCFYCHAHVEKPSECMSFELVERVLDEAVAIGSPTILLTGGEPFLYARIEDVLRGCHDRRLACKIATHGALIGPRQVEMLQRYGVRSLQISLDTLDPDLYASIKAADRKTHARVLDGIRCCVAAHRLHVVVSSVAERRVLPGLPELMRFCQREGLDTFTLYHLIPYGRAAGAASDWLSEQEYIETVDELMSVFSELPGERSVDLSVPWAERSTLLQKWVNRLDIRPVGCIAGKSSMTILADGEAVPCVCLEDHFFSCGNAWRQTLRELWSAPAMRFYRGEASIPSCKGCDEYAFCLGGCRALAFLASQKADGPDPACRHWKPVPRDAEYAAV
jgi:radical SAM protein with 4Fe4S-binding SPASM domain